MYATGTDVPFLEPRWILHLAELIGDADLAIPSVAGFFQPLAALYRKRSTMPALEALLKEGRPGPVSLVESVKTLVVFEDEMRMVDPLLGTLRNLNHPEEYERALRDAESSE